MNRASIREKRKALFKKLPVTSERFAKERDALRKDLERENQERQRDIAALKRDVWRATNAIRSVTPAGNLNFEVHLAEHCNLNCYGCMHYSPLAEPALADLEELRRDFQRIAELFVGGRIGRIHLMGGEPLLHPNIGQVLDMTRAIFPSADICLVTNAILLLDMGEAFWQSCRENHIAIAPTKYPIGLDYECIETCARERGVDYFYFAAGNTVKTSWRWAIHERGTASGTDNFLFCEAANKCIQLRQGKLYTCPIAAHVHHAIRYFDLKVTTSPWDGIDIYQAASAEEILRFLASPIPFCRYCDMGRLKKNLPWETSQRKKEEWVY